MSGYTGKHSTASSAAGKRRSGRKLGALALAAVLLTLAAVGGTLAYVKYSTSAVSNSFATAEAPVPTVDETFDGVTKTNVSVTLSQQGGGSYFVRAVILVSLENDAGEKVARVPVLGTDYTMTMGSGWTEHDGYWYYNGTVLPGECTSNLIVSCSSLNEDWHLAVDIAAQTIQSAPSSAALTEWGYVPASA